MNDVDFETSARHAAAWLRGEADRVADTESALSGLLDGGASGARTMERAPIEPDRHRVWLAVASAAAVVALIAGIVVVNGQRSASPAVEPPAPTTVAVPDSVPPATTDVPSTTIPPTTVAPDLTPSAIVTVDDSLGEPLQRRVLATYTEGDGPGQLGTESCRECEPMRPAAPVVTDDGTVFVADRHNGRWQVFRDGTWTASPFRPGEVVVGSPVVGPDGLIYALVAEDFGSTPRSVVSYDPADLSLVETFRSAPSWAGSVDLINGVIEASEVEMVDLGVPLGQATWDVDWEANTITVALSGVRRTFQLPSSWYVTVGGFAALEDGSVVVQVWSAPSDTDSTGHGFLVRLWADGTTATGTLMNRPSTTDRDAEFTRDGLVQLEDGEIAEYDLPARAVEPEPELPIVTQTDAHTWDSVADEVDVAWESARIPRACGQVWWEQQQVEELRCAEVVVDPSGVPVTYDPSSRVISRQTRGSEPVSFALPDDVVDPHLIAAGPDEIAYFALDNNWPTASDVLAVSIAPDDAGTELGRFAEVMPIGDGDMFVTSLGLDVADSHGPDFELANETTQIVEWIHRDGGEGETGDFGTFSHTGFSDAAGTVTAGNWQWQLADRLIDSDGSGTGHVIGTYDGGFLALYTEHTGVMRAEVMRGYRDGSVEHWLLPGSWVDLGLPVLEPQGTFLLPNGDTFVRVSPFGSRPNGWDGRLQIDPEEGTAEAVGLNEYIDSYVNSLSDSGDGTEPWKLGRVAFADAVAGPLPSPAELRTITVAPPTDGRFVVTVITEGHLDDSVFGTKLVVRLHSVEGGLRVDMIEWSQACQPDRGQQDYRPELCV